VTSIFDTSTGVKLNILKMSINDASIVTDLFTDSTLTDTNVSDLTLSLSNGDLTNTLLHTSLTNSTFNLSSSDGITTHSNNMAVSNQYNSTVSGFDTYYNKLTRDQLVAKIAADESLFEVDVSNITICLAVLLHLVNMLVLGMLEMLLIWKVCLTVPLHIITI